MPFPSIPPGYIEIYDFPSLIVPEWNDNISLHGFEYPAKHNAQYQQYNHDIVFSAHHPHLSDFSYRYMFLQPPAFHRLPYSAADNPAVSCELHVVPVNVFENNPSPFRLHPVTHCLPTEIPQSLKHTYSYTLHFQPDKNSSVYNSSQVRTLLQPHHIADPVSRTSKT